MYTAHTAMPKGCKSNIYLYIYSFSRQTNRRKTFHLRNNFLLGISIKEAENFLLLVCPCVPRIVRKVYCIYRDSGREANNIIDETVNGK